MTLAMDRPLTKRQRQIREEIARFHAEHGYWATVRQLQAKFRFASPNAVWSHLKALRAKGAVTWEPGQARTIRTTGGTT